MQFFEKRRDSTVVVSGWSYESRSDRPKIRAALRDEQAGFCAYSEKVLMPTDSVHIDHYDPRLKSTPADGYENWYLVGGWFNEHKAKAIEKLLPIIDKPHLVDMKSRINYQDGFFEPARPDDVEAVNFLKFIGVNRPELVEERMAHTRRIADVFNQVFEADFSAFRLLLLEDKRQLSFISALEAVLGVGLLDLAREASFP